jgi:hypothetical protein
MKKSINCPKCSYDIDLTEALYDDLKHSFSKDIDKEVELRTLALQKQLSSLTALLETYSEEAQESKLKAIELETKLKSVDKEIELKTFEQVNKEVEKIRLEVESEAELKVQEKVDTIEQLKEQLSIAQRKANQGSMQQQGEAQEVLIEEYLKLTFPFDTIDEIKKGAMGADVVQLVTTVDGIVGKVYYESKRTKTFNNAWIDKFKQDMIENGSDVGVLISSARPKNFSRAGMIKGVWVCSFDEFKIISQMIREALIKINKARNISNNLNDKMSMLYKYLTSNEFKLQVETIVEGFSQMQEDLNSEKRSMKMLWNKREKQIQKVVDNTVGMYGSIRGLVGNEVKTIHKLEL